MSVRRVPNDHSASERARWLAELAAALAEAQQLVWRIDAADAMELYGRLEAVQTEVQALRAGRLQSSCTDIDPEWAQSLPPWPYPRNPR